MEKMARIDRHGMPVAGAFVAVNVWIASARIA